MTKPDLGQCCEQVYDADGAWGHKYATCSRRASVERYGKPYCKQHDPVSRIAKLKEKADARKAKREADRAQARRDRTLAAMSANVPTERLEAIAAAGGLVALLAEYDRMKGAAK